MTRIANSEISFLGGKNLFKAKRQNSLAERGFDPRTSGLWAQHASTAPLCSPMKPQKVIPVSARLANASESDAISAALSKVLCTVSLIYLLNIQANDNTTIASAVRRRKGTEHRVSGNKKDKPCKVLLINSWPTNVSSVV